MEFENNKPLYIQIIDEIIDKIIKEEYQNSDKMMSIRDLAKKYLVNQNTAMKCMKELENRNIVENRRGIGYFVTSDKKLILNLKKEKIKYSLNNFLHDMHVAGLTNKEIIELIESEE